LGLGAPRSRKATLRAKRAFPQFSVAPLRVRPAKSGGTPLLFLALPWLPPLLLFRKYGAPVAPPTLT